MLDSPDKGDRPPIELKQGLSANSYTEILFGNKDSATKKLEDLKINKTNRIFVELKGSGHVFPSLKSEANRFLNSLIERFLKEHTQD